MLSNKIVLLTIGLMWFGNAAYSATLRADTGPAEIPPNSFLGKQYVDSKGCVYIRAGSGARVTWIPRVNRQRQVFCSSQNKPSLNAIQLAAITGKPVTRINNNQKPVTTVKKDSVVAKKTTQVQVATQPATAKKSVRGNSASVRRANRKAIKAKQKTSISKTYNAAERGVDPIHGLTLYSTVIDADVTPEGDAQMELVWTNTVPRKLVKKTRAKKVVRKTTYAISSKSQNSTLQKSTKAVKSSLQAAKQAARYVQIGTFGNPANTKKTITRFQSRGWPVRTKAIKRDGKNLRIVFLGPFKSSNQAQDAMSAARLAGFTDAFYVR